jgi:hypothetical protein
MHWTNNSTDDGLFRLKRVVFKGCWSICLMIISHTVWKILSFTGLRFDGIELLFLETDCIKVLFCFQLWDSRPNYRSQTMPFGVLLVVIDCIAAPAVHTWVAPRCFFPFAKVRNRSLCFVCMCRLLRAFNRMSYTVPIGGWLWTMKWDERETKLSWPISRYNFNSWLEVRIKATRIEPRYYRILSKSTNDSVTIFDQSSPVFGLQLRVSTFVAFSLI